MAPSTHVASRIRDLRLENLLTQKQLAVRLDVEPVTVSRWERGEAPPSPLNRVKLARVFGVHPNEFRDLDDAT